MAGAVKPLSGRRVVVIGGSSGIGRAIALAARTEDASVLIGSSDEARLISALQAFGRGVEGRVVDLRSETSLAAFAAEVRSVDHLVVTAHAPGSAGTIKPISQLAIEELEAIYQVKVFGLARAVRALLPKLSQDGSIVLISGAASRRMIPGHVALGGVNAAVEAMGKHLARELAPIRVNVVCPGLTRSEAYDRMPDAAREAMYAKASAALPVGRVGEVSEIAQAALYFMTNRFCTGAVLDCDGGGLLVGAPKG